MKLIKQWLPLIIPSFFIGSGISLMLIYWNPATVGLSTSPETARFIRTVGLILVFAGFMGTALVSIIRRQRQ